MLTLTSGPSALSGVGSPAVQKLQVALKNLAQVSGKPIIDPGDPDGVVGSKTINAVIGSMTLLTRHLGALGGVISGGLAIYSIADRPKAVQLITQYASQLEQAAKAAAIAVAQGAQSPATVPGTLPSIQIAAPPWYKTWWGMGAIGIGAVGVLALAFSGPRRAAAKAA